ncbi:MAG: hypothetical protein MK105_12400 [Crocinitomicaceae bacterium]|nr:hypothetical protein [Crocinitomicaceae bacterium]
MRRIALASHKILPIYLSQDYINTNVKIDSLIKAYGECDIPNREKYEFDELTSNFDELKKLEKSAELDYNPGINELIEVRIKQLNYTLKDMAEDQMEGGRKEVMRSQRAMETVNLFTSMEVYALIILALIVQVLILYKPKKKTFVSG